MKHDRAKIEEVALALLGLTRFQDGSVLRAWKGMDWEVLDGLFHRGWIHDPKGKAKSIVFTEEGARLVGEFQDRHFASGAPADDTTDRSCDHS